MKKVFLSTILCLFTFMNLAEASHITDETVNALVNPKIRNLPYALERIEANPHLDEEAKQENILNIFNNTIASVAHFIRDYNIQEIVDTIYNVVEDYKAIIDDSLFYTSSSLMDVIEHPAFIDNVPQDTSGVSAYILHYTLEYHLKNISDSTEQYQRTLNWIKENEFCVVVDGSRNIGLVRTNSFLLRLFYYTDLTERDNLNPSEISVRTLGRALKNLDPEDYNYTDLDCAACIPTVYLTNQQYNNNTINFLNDIPAETLKAIFYCSPFMFKFSSISGEIDPTGVVHTRLGLLYTGALSLLDAPLPNKYAPYYIDYFKESYLCDTQACIAYLISLSWVIGEIPNHHLNFINLIMEKHNLQDLHSEKKNKKNITLALVDVISRIEEGEHTLTEENKNKLITMIKKNLQLQPTTQTTRGRKTGRGRRKNAAPRGECEPQLTATQKIQKAFIEKKKNAVSEIEKELAEIKLKNQKLDTESLIDEEEEAAVEALIIEVNNLVEIVAGTIEQLNSIPVSYDREVTQQIRQEHDNIQALYIELTERKKELKNTFQNSYRIQLNKIASRDEQNIVTTTPSSSKGSQKGPKQKRRNQKKKTRIQQTSTKKEDAIQRSSILSWKNNNIAQTIFEEKSWIQPYPKKSYLVLQAINSCKNLSELRKILGKGGDIKPLEGLEKNWYSCRINDQYRVVFYYNKDQGGFENVAIGDYHH